MNYAEVKEITKRLRLNQTPEEKYLWRFIRKKQLDNRKFIRQHAIIYDTTNDDYSFYIPDFFCFEENLAVELEGKIHDFRRKKDQNRDAILNEMGIKVLRIKNEELQNIDKVLDKIKNSFEKNISNAKK